MKSDEALLFNDETNVSHTWRYASQPVRAARTVVGAAELVAPLAPVGLERTSPARRMEEGDEHQVQQVRDVAMAPRLQVLHPLRPPVGPEGGPRRTPVGGRERLERSPLACIRATRPARRIY